MAAVSPEIARVKVPLSVACKRLL